MSYNDLTNNYKQSYGPLKSLKSEDITISSCEEQGGFLKIHGSVRFSSEPAGVRNLHINLASLYMILNGNDFMACIRIDRDTKYYFLPNYKDYVILSSDGHPVPKLLVSSLPKAAYHPANSRNCFVAKEGGFIEIIGDGFEEEKIFSDLDKKEHYITFDRLDEQYIRRLMVNVIKRYTRYI